MKTHTVPDGVQAVALARYLSRAWPHIPGHAIRALLKRRDVRINGARCGADALVSSGDCLIIYLDESYFRAPLAVLFQDEQLLVLDKPFGLPVDTDEDGIGEDTLIARARAQLPTAQLCHRLDVGTGGALICALTDGMHEVLLSAFAHHEIEKRYAALVCGRPNPMKSTAFAYLQKDAQRSIVRIYDHPGSGRQAIETRYEVLIPHIRKAFSLCEIELITGRTHQIRAHMAHIGHPLIGDDKYGNRALNKRLGVKSPQLWCTRLSILSDSPHLARYRGIAFVSKPKFAIALG